VKLTVGGDGRGPICDHGGGAAGAARFVHELPGEDCGGGFVTVYDECDPGFVYKRKSQVSQCTLMWKKVEVGDLSGLQILLEIMVPQQ